MEKYLITIESQERYTNDEGVTKYGPVTSEVYTIFARSETEASQIASRSHSIYNNVMVERVE